MGRNKAGWGEKGDAEEGKVRAGSSKPPWGRSQTGAGSFYLSSQDQAGARKKEQRTADREGEMRAVGDSIISVSFGQFRFMSKSSLSQAQRGSMTN